MSTPAIRQTTTSTWKIDPVHSGAEFKVKHMMISNVKGQFTAVTADATSRWTIGQNDQHGHRRSSPDDEACQMLENSGR